MDQQRINSNLTNALSVMNKAVMNMLDRQAYMFNRLGDQKYYDLTMLDHDVLTQLQTMLDQMKKAINP